MVLADAELELVPSALRGHPAVRASARKRGRSPSSLLLDSSLHHAALRKAEDGARRGRPDLVHLFLVLCLDSLLNQEGRLAILVHTREDALVRVDPKTRIPKNYNRFCGLMEDLFARGVVPSEEEPLLRLERDTPLADALAGCPGRRIVLVRDGRPIDPLAYFAADGDVVAVVGGFPHGDFRSPVRRLCDDAVSLAPTPLKVWTATSEVLVAWRLARRSPS
jgi:rRNA small subunit pseudouridine methyltransferase Nep1